MGGGGWAGRLAYEVTAIALELFYSPAFRWRRLILSIVITRESAGDPVTRSTQWKCESRVTGCLAFTRSRPWPTSAAIKRAKSETSDFAGHDTKARSRVSPGPGHKTAAVLSAYCGFTNRPTRPAAPFVWPLSLACKSGSVRPGGSSLASRSVAITIYV